MNHISISSYIEERHLKIEDEHNGTVQLLRTKLSVIQEKCQATFKHLIDSHKTLQEQNTALRRHCSSGSFFDTLYSFLSPSESEKEKIEKIQQRKSLIEERIQGYEKLHQVYSKIYPLFHETAVLRKNLATDKFLCSDAVLKTSERYGSLDTQDPLHIEYMTIKVDRELIISTCSEIEKTVVNIFKEIKQMHSYLEKMCGENYPQIKQREHEKMLIFATPYRKMDKEYASFSSKSFPSFHEELNQFYESVGTSNLPLEAELIPPSLPVSKDITQDLEGWLRWILPELLMKYNQKALQWVFKESPKAPSARHLSISSSSQIASATSP